MASEHPNDHHDHDSDTDDHHTGAEKSLNRRASQLAKKKNKKIDKKHPEFELTYDMMLGIRTTVGQVESKPWRELTTDDFEDTTHWRFPSEGTATTPAHNMRDFKFKDYQPEVFRHLRERFGIKPEDYLTCVCGNFQYLEFISNSKSGQFFFYTHDRQFMIKTVSQDESKYLRQILPHYYEHVMQNPNTLLTRFFGMHRVKPHKKNEVHFLIFGSVFFSGLSIDKTFDLKGSTQGRKVTKKEKQSGNPVFKDLDLQEMGVKIRIGPQRAALLREQLARDSEFLKQLNIMDYSLLLGIHKKRIPQDAFDVPKKGKENGVEEKKEKASPPAKPHTRTASEPPQKQVSFDPMKAPDADGAVAKAAADDAKEPVANQNPVRSASGSSAKKNPIVKGFSKDDSYIPDDEQEIPAAFRRDKDTEVDVDAQVVEVVEDLPDVELKRSLTTPDGDMMGNPNPSHRRRRSRYGLPKKYNKITTPDIINFEAPEFNPIKLVGGDEKQAQQRNKTVVAVTSLFTREDGGIRGMDKNGKFNNEIYFMGIIDILTTYGVKKRGEHFLKALQYDANTISAVDPTQYAERFRTFLNQYIE